MIHSSYLQPRIFPYNGTGSPVQIDRLQDLSGNPSLNREKINEIGRDGTVDWRKGVPSVAMSARQFEYGNLEFWRKITNKSDATNTLTLNDFKTSVFDIAGYKTDDDGTFLGTIWYPKQRVAGWGLNIGDPDAIIERTFNFIGEDETAFTDNNKYVIYLTSTATGAGHQIVIGSGGFANYPDPVALPDESGAKYFIRILRYRGTTTTELVEGTDFTYNSGTTTITIANSSASDVFKVYYTASTYVSGGSLFTNNDSDLGAITADSCSILLVASDYVYRLQSVGIDVSFDRTDVKEIGNSEIVARGIRENTVSITLGRILENYTIEQVLRGATSGYGQYDIREFQDNIKLIVKVYSDKTKSTFKIGYSFTNLTPSSLDLTVPTKDYVNRGTTLSGESATITVTEGSL